MDKHQQELSNQIDYYLTLEEELRELLILVKQRRQEIESEIDDSYNNLVTQINELLKD